jgi:hypothetical protein
MIEEDSFVSSVAQIGECEDTFQNVLFNVGLGVPPLLRLNSFRDLCCSLQNCDTSTNLAFKAEFKVYLYPPLRSFLICNAVVVH